MTIFFCFVRKSYVEVLSYHSEAEGRLQKQTNGFRFAKVVVRTEVALKQQGLAGKVRELGGIAGKYCLVSRSAAYPVDYQLEVGINEKRM